MICHQTVLAVLLSTWIARAAADAHDYGAGHRHRHRLTVRS
jgi:hypothetical protein